MLIARLLKSSGLAAVAIALALPALGTPAAAQDRQWSNQTNNRGTGDSRSGSGRRDANTGNRSGSDWRGQRSQPSQTMRDARREARQIDRRSERQAARIEDRGERRAERAADNGNYRRAQQIENRSERQANRVERRGDWRAAETVRDARRDVTRDGNRWRDNDRRDYRDSNRDRDYRDNNRNRDYRDANRNRDYRDARRDYRQAQRDHRRWDRNDWRRDQRYNWNNYRRSNRTVFQLGRYYSPYRNYNYRRVNIGFRLDSLFYSNRYWINDPWQYRLPEVYGPYRWVRYYDDVLLVDMYTGEVVDTIYDFFW